MDDDNRPEFTAAILMRPDTLAEVARRVSAGAEFGPTLSEFLDEFYLNPEHPRR